jgi:hypothetical protein
MLGDDVELCAFSVPVDGEKPSAVLKRPFIGLTVLSVTAMMTTHGGQNVLRNQSVERIPRRHGEPSRPNILVWYPEVLEHRSGQTRDLLSLISPVPGRLPRFRL